MESALGEPAGGRSQTTSAARGSNCGLGSARSGLAKAALDVRAHEARFPQDGLRITDYLKRGTSCSLIQYTATTASVGMGDPRPGPGRTGGRPQRGSTPRVSCGARGAGVTPMSSSRSRSTAPAKSQMLSRMCRVGLVARGHKQTRVDTTTGEQNPRCKRVAYDVKYAYKSGPTILGYDMRNRPQMLISCARLLCYQPRPDAPRVQGRV